MYYGETDRTRGIFDYTLTEVSGATYRVTLRSRLQGKSYYYSGYRVSSKIANETVDSDLGHQSSLSTSWETFLDTGNYNKSYTRTHSDQQVVIGSSYAGEGDGEANAGNKSGSVSVTVTIPARPSYTVSYNPNGGTGGPTSQKKWYNETLTLLSSTPTRTGFSFIGWLGSDGIDYSPSGSYTGNEELTLTAKWTPVTYVVSYGANGGSGAPSAGTKTHGVAYTVSSTVPTRSGYNFTGWKDATSGTVYQPGGTIAATVNRAIALVAQWSITAYRVSYDANGGSGAPAAQMKNHGSTLTLSSTVPTRTGYSFLGWGTTPNASTASYQPGGSYTANASATLYAVWSIIKYTVSYNPNGGTGAPSSQTKTYGVALTLSSTVPTRTNYTFLGWSSSQLAKTADYQAGGSYTANAGITLYAVWETSYTPPKIYYGSAGSIPIIRRNSSDQTAADVKFNWSVFASGSIQMTIRYRLLNSTGSYTQLWGQTVTGQSGSVNQTVKPTGGFSVNDSYSIRIGVYDGTHLTEYYGILSSGFVTINVSAANRGKSIGIGQAPVETNVPSNGRIDIGMDVYVQDRQPVSPYKAGDTIALTNLAGYGYIGQSVTSAVIYIPLPKPATGTPNLTSLVGLMGGVSGKIDGSDGTTEWVGKSGVTLSYSLCTPSLFRVIFTKTTGFKDPSNNNTPANTPIYLNVASVSISL